MTEAGARITVPEGEPELEIVAHSIARALGDRGTACSLAFDESDALGILLHGQRLMLRWDGGRGALVDLDFPLVLTPAVHPELIPPPPLSRTRLTFRPEGGLRRQRMTERTIRELRRRGMTGSVTAVGSCDLDWPDESFPALSGAETLRLLASSRALLDASSHDEPPHLLTRIAIACGYPVVISASGSVGSAHVKSVDEWSADAYADAILSDHPAVGSTDRAGIDVLVDEIEKAFLLA